MDFRTRPDHNDLFPGIRNNNPGNLRPSNRYAWEGQVGAANNFCVFSEVKYGLRALAIDLLNKFERGLTSIKAIIEVYAPPMENKTKAYYTAVSNSISAQLHTKIEPEAQLQFNRPLLGAFIRAIVNHENGTQASLVDSQMINEALDLLPPALQGYAS